MSSDTSKLYNAIVILGAALAVGCGGGSGSGTKPNSGDSGTGNNQGYPQFNVSPDAGNSDAGWTGW